MGIVCEVFKGDNNLVYFVVIVYLFLGVGIVKGLFDYVCRKVCSNLVVRKWILDVKCVVWDECFMGSVRLLELFYEIIL